MPFACDLGQVSACWVAKRRRLALNLQACEGRRPAEVRNRMGRHRRPSQLRTTVRTGSMLAVTAAAGLGVTATAQAATDAPVAPAAASHAHTWQHWQHVAHVAHAARYYHPAHLAAYKATYRGSTSGSFQSCVVARESGGDPRAVNPYSGAGGLYQFLPSTFRALGYSGRPQDAPVWEQTEAFHRLYAQAGRGPWSSNGC